MELKIEVGLDELLRVIQQLPESQKAILREELNKKVEHKTSITDFQEFLLSGPVMSDREYKSFKETRKQFKNWSKR